MNLLIRSFVWRFSMIEISTLSNQTSQICLKPHFVIFALTFVAARHVLAVHVGLAEPCGCWLRAAAGNDENRGKSHDLSDQVGFESTFSVQFEISKLSKFDDP